MIVAIKVKNPHTPHVVARKNRLLSARSETRQQKGDRNIASTSQGATKILAPWTTA